MKEFQGDEQKTGISADKTRSFLNCNPQGINLCFLNKINHLRKTFQLKQLIFADCNKRDKQNHACMEDQFYQETKF